MRLVTAAGTQGRTMLVAGPHWVMPWMYGLGARPHVHVCCPQGHLILENKTWKCINLCTLVVLSVLVSRCQWCIIGRPFATDTVLLFTHRVTGPIRPRNRLTWWGNWVTKVRVSFANNVAVLFQLSWWLVGCYDRKRECNCAIAFHDDVYILASSGQSIIRSSSYTYYWRSYCCVSHLLAWRQL